MPADHSIVSKQAAGQKLIQFLSRYTAGAVPGGLLMKLVRTGQVRVDGRRKKPFFRVQEGQVVRIPPVLVQQKGVFSSGAALPALPVVHEAADWIVVRKPAGLPMRPGNGGNGGSDYQDAVTTRLEAMFAGASFLPTPAHRLDKDTAGLLLTATSYTGLTMLHSAFQQRTLEKYYLAEVHGHVPQGAQLSMTDQMEKRTVAPGTQRVVTGTGKTARATASGLWTARETSLLEIVLHTGRTHQIRVQLASRGLPVRGDKKYGRSADTALLRLHAWKLRLPDGTVIQDRPWWSACDTLPYMT